MIIPKNKYVYVELLYFFLKNWNKKFEGYSTKNVGIPMDEIGDTSRLIANYYLQEYDKIIFKLCKRYNARYLRYADDQIFFTLNREDALKLLFQSSKELFKIGLDINSSKVIEFENLISFRKYWAFDIFNYLDDKKNRKNINKAFQLYSKYKLSRVKFKEFSVLKRLVSVDFKLLRPSAKKILFTQILRKDFVSNLDYWFLNKIYQVLNPRAKKGVFEIVENFNR
ncbi:MAG: hypothetical protein UZ05_CHB002000190 [Chlorobi bacterium OLB5]|nr:MAG: hypothetical protein UZ05_CHB002000190 [Chlorobi bacterium OLB5]